MTKKSATHSVKGKTLTYLQKKSTEWKSTVSKDADQIDNAKSTIDKAKDKLDTYDEYLQKQNGYNSLKDAYNAKQDEIDKQKKLLSKTKKSSKKKSIESTIKDLTKQKKEVYQSITKLTNTAEYQKQLKARTKANHAISVEKKKINDINAKKTKDKKVYQTYHNAYVAKKRVETKKKQTQNRSKINDKIAAAKKKYKIHKNVYLNGLTTIQRADAMTSRVFILGESDPSETNDQDVPTNEVDNSDPRTNYSVRSSKQLSGTYYLFGKTSDLDTQFEILQGWARKGIEVTVRGFSKWAHAYLSSVGKTANTAGNKNSLALSLTFTYAMKSKIDYAKKKSKKKTKSSSTKKSGTKKTTHKTTTVKTGMTYWSISQKTGVKVSKLEKLNKWPATSIPVGAKVRYE